MGVSERKPKHCPETDIIKLSGEGFCRREENEEDSVVNEL